MSIPTKAFSPLLRTSIARQTPVLTRTARIHTAPRSALKSYRMASIVQQVTDAAAAAVSASAATAHSAFATLASKSPIKVGDKVPDVEIKETMDTKVNFSKLTGKNILVLVPGAFSPTCSSQVPSYIDLYDDFKSKGVNEIWCVAVNDAFVIKAWKKDMYTRASKDENSANVKFAADDAGAFASAVGLVLNAQANFGGPRLQRAVIVYDNGVVTHVAVEENPGKTTITDATEVIGHL